DVIAAYHTVIAEEVGRFGGFVAKYMGDGVLVYFGYPQAQEDDAERAVRAGLSLIERVPGLDTAARLRTRIGIATGLVVAAALIGREDELELLLRRWRRAADGEGQLVLLSGEAGIGKSRLTAALQERLGREPHIRLRYFCSPHHRDSPLHPFIAQLERAVAFE